MHPLISLHDDSVCNCHLPWYWEAIFLMNTYFSGRFAYRGVWPYKKLTWSESDAETKIDHLPIRFLFVYVLFPSARHLNDKIVSNRWKTCSVHQSMKLIHSTLIYLSPFLYILRRSIIFFAKSSIKWIRWKKKHFHHLRPVISSSFHLPIMFHFPKTLRHVRGENADENKPISRVLTRQLLLT